MWINIKENAIVDSNTRWIPYKTSSYKGFILERFNYPKHGDTFQFVARALVLIEFVAFFGAITQYTGCY